MLGGERRHAAVRHLTSYPVLLDTFVRGLQQPDPVLASPPVSAGPSGMMNGARVLPPSRRGPRALAAAWLAALAVAALAACGGDEAPTASADEATVITKEVAGYGNALAANSGDPVYIFDADPEGGSSCTGECTEQWTPLEADGEPTAGPGVEASLLSSFERDDGTTQVLYDDKALYTHEGEGLAAGAETDGGTWYLVDPSGEAIEGTASGGY